MCVRARARVCVCARARVCVCPKTFDSGCVLDARCGRAGGSRFCSGVVASVCVCVCVASVIG